MKCIFCDIENDAKSIEHIVSESFGNKSYVMEKGRVCDKCNQKFSKFEGNALANSVFAMERARFGIITKKGKNVKGKVDELIIEGDEKFRKTYLSLQGLNLLTFTNYRGDDPENAGQNLNFYPNPRTISGGLSIQF